MKKIVILYSGGLDSRIMLHLAQTQGYDAKCIYYRHGADSEQREIETLPDYVEVKTVDWLGDRIKPVAKADDPFAAAIYIPGRNLVFSVLAACQELPDEVWMGTLVDEMTVQGTDKNLKFKSMATEVLSYVLSPFKERVQVVFPLADRMWTKIDSVKWALENGLTKDQLRDTVSCWHHKGLPCGKCKQCFKREMIFALNGFHENYASYSPLNSQFGLELLKQYLQHPKDQRNQDETTIVKMIVEMSCLEPWHLVFQDPEVVSLIDKELN